MSKVLYCLSIIIQKYVQNSRSQYKMQVKKETLGPNLGEGKGMKVLRGYRTVAWGLCLPVVGKG